MAQHSRTKSRPRAQRTTRQYLEAGRMTGFEPEALKGLHYPKGPKVHGVPGEGLDEAGYSAKATQLGTQGEKLFSRALKTLGITKKVHSFWSVTNPDPERFAKTKYSRGDVDCVLAFGNTILLIDVKFYTSGKGAWRMNDDGESLTFYAHETGEPFGEPRAMSHVMSQAHKTFQQRFRKARVLSLVVFMPTDRGEADLENITWPGGIMAVNFSDFIPIINTLIEQEQAVKKRMAVDPERIEWIESLLASAPTKRIR